jgi:predicted O-methyltransferase YrrM
MRAGQPAVARALRRVALGRIDAAERAWIERIDAQRLRAAEGPPDSLRAAVPHWSIPRVWGLLLFCLVRELRPATAMELGIGFGFSGCYQAAALELNGGGRLVALDQEPELVEIARENVAALDLADRVEIRMGPIGETLPGAAAAAAPIDFAYIDAEHTESATVWNFEELLPHLAPGAVVVVDDIRMDAGMRRAWMRVRHDRRIGAELSLRRLGIAVLSA